MHQLERGEDAGKLTSSAFGLPGKHVVGTAGAGMLDEFNRSNAALQQEQVFGVMPTALRVDPMSIAWVKQVRGGHALPT